MKNTSKNLLAAAIGIAVVGAAGIIINSTRKGRSLSKKSDTACRNGKREKLNFVKTRLERHRERLDRYLNKINSKIETYSPAVTEDQTA